MLLLTKAGDVETNPGPTTLNKKVWICDICHEQIQVRKQISIRCNMIEQWVHLRCAGIRQAQYTDTWTCHFNNLILVYICIPDGALVYIGRKDDGIEEKKGLKVLLIVEDRKKSIP